MDWADETGRAADRAYVELSWQRYFAPEADTGADAPPLPDPDVDLGPYLRDLIPGKRGRRWVGRMPVLTEQFAKIEPEFRGTPRITHLMVCTIVTLRRDPANPQARRLFWRILDETGPQIALLLNSRWLTSICDTVVDIAERDLDRAAALIGTIFINTLKIAETERRLYLPQRPWPPATRLRRGGRDL